MNWREFVLNWSAAQIMEWTGAPKRTVYGWREGSSTPPQWYQPILKAHIIDSATADLLEPA